MVVRSVCKYVCVGLCVCVCVCVWVCVCACARARSLQLLHALTPLTLSATRMNTTVKWLYVRFRYDRLLSACTKDKNKWFNTCEILCIWCTGEIYIQTYTEDDQDNIIILLYVHTFYIPCAGVPEFLYTRACDIL